MSPCLDIHHVTVAEIDKNTMLLPLHIRDENDEEETVEIKALLDTGTGRHFIDQNYTRKFKKHNLNEPIKVCNVNGTKNKQGTIRQYVDLMFNLGTKKFNKRLYITGLGKQKIILGFPWIQEHNPLIDWKKGQSNGGCENQERWCSHGKRRKPKKRRKSRKTKKNKKTTK